MKNYKYYFSFCIRLKKSYFILYLTTEILQTLLLVIGITLPKFILDAVFYQYNFNKAVVYTALLLISTFVINLLTAIISYYAERSRDQMYRKFSLLFAEKIMKGDYQNLENPEYLNAKEKALFCMSGQYGFAGGVLLLTKLIGQILRFAVLAVITVFLDLRLLPIFAVLIFLSVATDAYAKRKNAEIDMNSALANRMERYFYDISENPMFAKEVRVNDLGDWITRHYKEQFGIIHAYKVKKNSNICKSSIIGTISVVLQEAFAYGFLAYKAVEDIKNNTSFFPVGSFSMYLNAMLAFNSSVSETLMLVNMIKQMEVYIEPFKKFMSWSQNIELSNNAYSKEIEDNKIHSIRFEHVSFKYPGQKEYALKDISCEIKGDKKLALVGENGAGKSTFIKLIARLYDPEEGTIYLDGRDIKTISPDLYRDYLAFVFQDYKLYSMSLKENIVLNRGDDISDERIIDLLDKLGLSGKISNLKNGINTQVGKMFDAEGIEPSGGEAQKLAIARAFLKNASIVILDEPTAALDPKSECRLYEDFDKLTEGKGAIYISHRLASCKMCDDIYVFSKGKIVEQGKHEELMKQGGLYSEMFTEQAKMYV